MHDKPPGRRHRTAASDDLPTSIATGEIDARDLEGYQGNRIKSEAQIQRHYSA